MDPMITKETSQVSQATQVMIQERARAIVAVCPRAYMRFRMLEIAITEVEDPEKELLLLDKLEKWAWSMIAHDKFVLAKRTEFEITGKILALSREMLAIEWRCCEKARSKYEEDRLESEKGLSEYEKECLKYENDSDMVEDEGRFREPRKLSREAEDLKKVRNVWEEDEAKVREEVKGLEVEVNKYERELKELDERFEELYGD